MCSFTSVSVAVACSCNAATCILLELPSVLQRRSQAEQEEPVVVGRCLRSMARGVAALQAALTLASAMLTALLLLGRALG